MYGMCTECGKLPETKTGLCPGCEKVVETKCENQKKAQRQERIAALRRAWNGETEGWKDIFPPKKYHGAVWNTLEVSHQAQITPFLKGESDLLTFAGCPGAGKTWAAWATVGVFLLNHDDKYYCNHDYNGNHFFTTWYALVLTTSRKVKPDPGHSPHMISFSISSSRWKLQRH